MRFIKRNCDIRKTEGLFCVVGMKEDSVLPLTSSQVQYLVEELRFHIQCSAAKKERKERKKRSRICAEKGMFYMVMN